MEDFWQSDATSSEPRRVDCISRLRRLWTYEKMAPEILPFQTAVIDEVDELLASLEERLESLRDSGALDYGNLTQLHIDKCKFLLRSYYRTRLAKIQQFCFALSDATHPSRFFLSDNEQVFVDRLAAQFRAHFGRSFLDQLPEAYRSVGVAPRRRLSVSATAGTPLSAGGSAATGTRNASASGGGGGLSQENTVPEPDIDSHIFIRPLSSFSIDEGSYEANPLPLDAGKTYVVRYSAIRSKLLAQLSNASSAELMDLL